MAYIIIDDQGMPLDAAIDIDEAGMSLHSRGGGGRNPHYGLALRLLLSRLSSANLPIVQVILDSDRVQGLPVDERIVLTRAEIAADPAGAFQIASKRMAAVGQAPGTKGGNPTKKLRFSFAPAVSRETLEEMLGLREFSGQARTTERLPSDELYKVTPLHIWNALERLRNSEVQHPFGESTDYDLVTDDGVRFPPKAVFGLAATEALGMPVLPKHFSAGEGQPCFRILRAAGYLLVSKSELSTQPSDLAPDDRAWAEGNPRLVAHLKRERASGLAQAKKADFVARHGRLHCERCMCDPETTYGQFGTACIEVHHATKAISEMDVRDQTRLEDLQCLCANCHRVVHAELRSAQQPVK